LISSNQSPKINEPKITLPSSLPCHEPKHLLISNSCSSPGFYPRPNQNHLSQVSLHSDGAFINTEPLKNPQTPFSLNPRPALPPPSTSLLSRLAAGNHHLIAGSLQHYMD